MSVERDTFAENMLRDDITTSIAFNTGLVCVFQDREDFEDPTLELIGGTLIAPREVYWDDYTRMVELWRNKYEALLVIKSFGDPYEADFYSIKDTGINMLPDRESKDERPVTPEEIRIARMVLKYTGWSLDDAYMAADAAGIMEHIQLPPDEPEN